MLSEGEVGTFVTRGRIVGLLFAVSLAASLGLPVPGARAFAELPDQLSDRAFWRLVLDTSEPGGYFRSQDITNLTSNELGFQVVIPELVRRTTPGAVYVGVGPEQNFTYIAAVRPRMAVIVDIRRGNLDMQLMYKAMFELSRDRADFVAMLFARPRPSGITSASTAADLFRALDDVAASETLYRQNLAAIERRLLRVHGFALRPGDIDAIRTIYRTLFYSGVAVRAYPTYEDLMVSTDAEGVARSFLETEEAYAFVRDLQARNMVVPVVGDFAGPRAIQRLGAYFKSAGAVVGTFYLSNVEQYLYQDGRWGAFCRNVAALPLDASSTFIRSSTAAWFGFGRGGGFFSSLSSMEEDARLCGYVGR